MLLNPNLFPIDEQLEGIEQSLNAHSCVLLKAETGAGKTTRLPPFLSLKSKGKILVLEPRRLAAKLSAQRCAEILKTQIGESVGHHIRFDKACTSKTHLLFITEGLFLSYLREDPSLSQYSIIILDEFHERSIHTDTALCLIRKIQATTRPDLKLVIMSATLDTGKLEEYLVGAKVFNIPGRVFPIDIEYHDIDSYTATTQMIHDSRCPKNILVFLPGMGAIRDLQAKLKGNIPTDIEIVPLHSTLPKKEQDKAFSGSKKKIILSTNIAETSLTIPNITGVVDTGTERQSSFAPWSGMPLLQLEKISKASAIQRAGRAGRVQKGLVFRTYTKNDFSLRKDFTPPEIKRVELSHYILDLIQLGYHPNNLNWFEEPEERNLNAALELLHLIKALKDGEVTQIGSFISKIPVHPRLGTMLYHANELDNFNDVLLAVCLLNEGFVLNKQTRFSPEDGIENCDITLQLDLIKSSYWSDKTLSDYHPHLLNQKTYKRIIELFETLAARMNPKLKISHSKTDQNKLNEAILAGYSDRIAGRRKVDLKKGNKTNKKKRVQDHYNLCLGRGGKLSQASSLSSTLPEFLIVLDALENPKKNAAVGTTITVASKVTVDKLEKLDSDFLHVQNETCFNEKNGTLTLSNIKKYGNLTLNKVTGPPIVPLGETLCNLIKTNWPWPFDNDFFLEEYNQRVQIMNNAQVEHHCPEFSGEMLELLIETSVDEDTTYESLQKKGLNKLIIEQLSPQDKYILEKEVPLEITLMNKKKFKISYTDGKPNISARIQDLFGVANHPKIANETTPICFSLLSPANKAIQKSHDLTQLWGSSWELLRSDLRPRYPKHYWPDDPSTSLPIRMKKDL